MRIYLEQDGKIVPAVRCDLPGCSAVRMLPERARGAERYCSRACSRKAYERRHPERAGRPSGTRGKR